MLPMLLPMLLSMPLLLLVSRITTSRSWSWSS
jgi:hypothetical protein